MKQILSLLSLVCLLVILVPAVGAQSNKASGKPEKLGKPEKIAVAAIPTPTPMSAAIQMEPAVPGVGETAEEIPEYVLPYPGMLPDHPLYFLKQLRDVILDKLIVDPLRKTEFYVLQADKRLAMGIALVDTQKSEIAEEVISKGEKYLNSGVYEMLARKNEGKEVPVYLVEKLERAIDKHMEVLMSLIAKTSGSTKKGFEGSLELVQKLNEEAGKLK